MRSAAITLESGRRSRSALICPANRPDLIAKMTRYDADIVIIDLEDGTPEEAKIAAREQAIEGLAGLRDAGIRSRTYLRVNAFSDDRIWGDLEAAVRSTATGIAIPKAASAADVHAIERELFRLEFAAARTPLEVIIGIESVAGLQDVTEIAISSTRAVALYFGSEDYTTDLGGGRTRSGAELIYARSRIAIAARLAGIAALDYATLETADPDRLRDEAETGKALGYGGRICIHPAQVALAHDIYRPSDEEVDRARRLLETYHESLSRGNAVCSFEGAMIDGPLVRRAENVMALAAEPS